MEFIKLHSAEIGGCIIRVNIEQIVAYIRPKADTNITAIWTTGNTPIPVTETPEEIDALIEEAQRRDLKKPLNHSYD